MTTIFTGLYKIYCSYIHDLIATCISDSRWDLFIKTCKIDNTWNTCILKIKIKRSYRVVVLLLWKERNTHTHTHTHTQTQTHTVPVNNSRGRKGTNGIFWVRDEIPWGESPGVAAPENKPRNSTRNGVHFFLLKIIYTHIIIIIIIVVVIMLYVCSMLGHMVWYDIIWYDVMYD